MHLRSTSAEIRREFTRPIVLTTLVGYVGVTGFFAVASRSERLFLWLFPLTLAPLGLAPLAAYLVARDQSTGTTRVLFSTGLRRGEWLVAKALVLLLLLALSLILAAIVVRVALIESGSRAFDVNAGRFVWAFLVGIYALSFGIACGLVSGSRPAGAVGAAFTLCLAWIGLSAYGPEIIEAAGPGTAGAFALHVVHLSPLTWEYDFFPSVVHPIRVTGGILPAQAALVLTAAAVAGGAVVFSSRFQRADGTLRDAARRPSSALVVLSTAMLALSVPAGWTFADSDPGAHDLWTSVDGAIALDYSGIVPARPGATFGDLHDGDVATLFVTVKSTPARTIVFDSIQVVSDRVHFAPLKPGPYSVDTRDDGGAHGDRTLAVDFRVAVQYGGEPGHAKVVLTLQDGTQALLEGSVYVRPVAAPLGALAGSILVVLSPILLARFVVPSRLNRW